MCVLASVCVVCVCVRACVLSVCTCACLFRLGWKGKGEGAITKVDKLCFVCCVLVLVLARLRV